MASSILWHQESILLSRMSKHEAVQSTMSEFAWKSPASQLAPFGAPGNGNVEAWIEPHATEQWAFSPCKAKRAEHARPRTENERFGRWPVRPSEADTLRVGFQKKIPGVNELKLTKFETVAKLQRGVQILLFFYILLILNMAPNC